MHVGNLIREARLSCSVTQVELARRLNCSQTAVAQVEGRERISTETLEKVAVALGMTLEIRFTPKPQKGMSSSSATNPPEAASE